MEIRRCQHIKTNGQQCGSPAVRGLNSCYFHGTWGHTQRLTINEARTDPMPGALSLPVLEDYESIQMSILQIMHRVTTGHLDTKTGGLLLYALQIASSNLRYARFDPAPESVVIDLERVPDTPLDANQWDEDEEEDDDDDDDAEGDNGEGDDDEGDEEDLDEEDLNEELGDDVDSEAIEEQEEKTEEEEKEVQACEVSECPSAHVGADAPARPERNEADLTSNLNRNKKNHLASPTPNFSRPWPISATTGKTVRRLSFRSTPRIHLPRSTQEQTAKAETAKEARENDRGDAATPRS